MEHAFVLSYYSSVQMPIKEDEGFPRKLTNTGMLNKFHSGSDQEDHIQESQIEQFYSSDAGAFINRPTNDLPEAIPSLKFCAVGNVNVVANLQESSDKLIQTEEDKTKVKKLCYTDIGFSQPLPSEPEFNAGIAPVVSSRSRCLPEAYIPGTYRRPFSSYPGKRSEELNARKNKELKVYHDEPSKDPINQGQVRYQQNTIAPWNHLYCLADSVGSLKAPNVSSMDETGHRSQIPPSFMGFNFDLQEQVGDKQNERHYAKMLQNYNEMPDQVKQKSSLPHNLSNGKQPVQHSHSIFNASASNNSYHGPSVTSKSLTQPLEGIRTKVLSSSCSYQFFVKDSLNDNRSAAVRQVTVRSDDSMPKTRNLKSEGQSYEKYGEENCQPPGTSSAHAFKLNQHSSIEMNDVNLSDGFILRQWLSRRSCIVDKFENLHIFKQILELVELAHSQGLVLRNICPSCFMVSALNRVIFLESPPSQSKTESSKPQGCSSLNVVVRSPELNQNKKRSWHHLTMGTVEGQQSNQMLKCSDTGNLQREHHRIGMVASFQNQGSSVRSSSVNMCTGQACKLFSEGPGIEDSADGKLLSLNAESSRHGHERHKGQHQVREQTGGQCQSTLGLFDEKELLMLEENWYISPEELNGGTKTFSSDIYGLGVLLFELFCTFTSWEEKIRVMSDLRHRILPPCFLSEYPREAGFCLWLLHPDPCSRPRTREIIHSELFNEAHDALAERQAAVSLDEEDAETELLMDFLLCLQKQKQERACKLAQDVAYLMSDIEEVDKRHSLLTCNSPVATIQSGLATSAKDIARDMLDTSMNCFEQDGKKSNFDKKMIYQESSTGGVEQHSLNLDANPSRPQSFTSKGARLMKNFKHLEQVYFAMRGKIGPPDIDCTKSSKHVQNIPSKSSGILGSDCNRPRHGEYDYVDRLGCFFDSVCKYARYGRFEVRATLRHGDLLNTANVVCSVGFDRDQEFFAIAGVSKKIKVFGCDAVLNENVDIYYPAVEMISKSKLSSICWNSYIKSHLASTDYDGVVQLWDASTGQTFAQYKEHQKRAWSVDFSHADPTKLASGSDDCTVKLWSINQESSIGTIKTLANVCCVQFPPDSGNMITFGSADYKIYCYDLRNPKIPWCTLASHGKAVSYVKFVDSNTVVSASTDNTLKLWDLTKARSSEGSNSACSLTFTGHTNEKNFVGLSVAEGYIACGSETNSVFTYYKSLPMPLASHKFGFVDPISGQESEDDSGQFVSSVCWRGKSQILVAANSTGNIKLLEMV